MSDYIFSDSLENDRCLYYHFLDGFINKDFGNTIESSLNFINKKRKYLLTPEINILNKINISPHISRIDIIGLPESIYYKKDISSDKFDIIMENLKYSILPILSTGHITTMLFFIKDYKLNLLYFNSGDGIENHLSDKYGGGRSRPDLIYNDKYYSPFTGIELSNDIRIDIQTTINIFTSFILLYKLYNIINIKDSNFMDEITVDTNRQIYTIDNIITLINDINTLNPTLDINIHQFINPKIEIFHQDIYIYNSENRYSTDKINSLKPIKGDLNKTINKYFINKQDEYINESFHNILYAHLKKFKQFDINNYCENLNIFGSSLLFIKLNPHIEDKTTLHLINDNLYIKPQESGSCSWFSFYWAFVYYHILVKNNSLSYYNYINTVYDNFKKEIDYIFTSENIQKEYDGIIIFTTKKTIKNYNFILMKQLCDKLIKIDLIDKSILDNCIDFIYNINFDIDFSISNYFGKLNKKNIMYVSMNFKF